MRDDCAHLVLRRRPRAAQSSCKQHAERSSGSIRDWGLTLRAGSYGLGPAIAGAAIYYGVIAITEFEIGIVAILIGYMVGFAIKRGARGRGGRRLQVIGAALVYLAVCLAYLPLVIKGAVEGSKGEVAAETSTPTAPWRPTSRAPSQTIKAPRKFQALPPEAGT